MVSVDDGDAILMARKLDGALKRVCHTCCDPVDCTQLVRPPAAGQAPLLPFCPRRPC